MQYHLIYIINMQQEVGGHVNPALERQWVEVGDWRLKPQCGWQDTWLFHTLSNCFVSFIELGQSVCVL